MSAEHTDRGRRGNVVSPRPRTERMTGPQRFRALLAGQRLDHVPFMTSAISFSAVNVGYSIVDYYTDPEKAFWAQIWTQEMYGADGLPWYNAGAYCCREFGGEVKLPTSDFAQAPMVTRYPAESEKEVWQLELPDVKTAGAMPLYMEFAKLQERFSLPMGWPITCYCGTPFTRAGGVIGVDRLCRWVIKKPELVHRVLRLTTDFLMAVVQCWVDTFGAQNLYAREAGSVESNQLISPKQFQEFALPYLKELHEKILAIGIKHIYCHICGDQNLNLPYWAQVPWGDPSIATVGPEVDLATAIRYLGDKCVIGGNIRPAVIQTGTPQQIYELSRQCIEKAKNAPRGCILMPGCELPPKAPPYNVYVMKKAINDFGWYD